jgi:hypothetical protein
MNLPDFTLILQIINFYVAYAVMRKLVFTPALKIIEVQDSYQQSLERNIENAKSVKIQVTLQQKSRWNASKDMLYSLLPKLSQVCLSRNKSIDDPSLHQLQLSEVEQKSLVEKLCNQLSDVKS